MVRESVALGGYRLNFAPGIEHRPLESTKVAARTGRQERRFRSRAKIRGIARSLLVRSCPIVRSRSPAPSALARTTARPGLARALRKVGPDSLTTMHAHTADVELVTVLVGHVADAG